MQEIRLKNVPPVVKKELENIANNLGTTVNGLLKPKLREIINQYPEHLRNTPVKD